MSFVFGRFEIKPASIRGCNPIAYISKIFKIFSNLGLIFLSNVGFSTIRSCPDTMIGKRGDQPNFSPQFAPATFQGVPAGTGGPCRTPPSVPQ